MRVRTAIRTGLAGVLIIASALTAAPANACEPWDCPNVSPNPGPGGDGWYGPGDWIYGGWYGSGWYGGHYWPGGYWYRHWY